MELLAKDELIRSSIIDAAKKLFQQYGLAKTTMEDIARAIGKGKSSLYYYFATKEDIFEAVVLQEKKYITREVELAIQNVSTAEEKLRAFALTVYKELKNKRVIIMNILHADNSAGMCMMNMFKKKYDEIELKLIKSIIEFGIETGEFDRKYENQLDAISLLSISTLRGLQLNSVLYTTEKRNTLGLIDLSIDLLVKSLKK
ncbi:MAG: TetR/AcrR family transcriptional regulator [Sphingobacteriales bacterium]|nr:MAG: TetR/AcrR family transcriptional regulator [Sphingobacteriales bacterium]